MRLYSKLGWAMCKAYQESATPKETVVHVVQEPQSPRADTAWQAGLAKVVSVHGIQADSNSRTQKAPPQPVTEILSIPPPGTGMHPSSSIWPSKTSVNQSWRLCGPHGILDFAQE
jgi:hypothetical protein